MRGRQRNAAAESAVMAVHRPGAMAWSARAEASMRASVAATPPATPHTTKAPTAMSAASLTTASSAIAMTRPWWRSSASTVRVPKSTVKTASPPATSSAVPCSASGVAGRSAKTAKESVTDWSWSAT